MEAVSALEANLTAWHHHRRQKRFLIYQNGGVIKVRHQIFIEYSGYILTCIFTVCYGLCLSGAVYGEKGLASVGLADELPLPVQ